MISVVINTLNEEQNIKECISSLKGFADEIIVCDMYSEDNTVNIAHSLGAKIYYYEKTGYVEPARFYAITKASCPWILILDADERLTKELSMKLLELTKNNNELDLIKFASLYNYFGKYVKHGGFFKNDWTRFFKKELYLSSYSEANTKIFQGLNNLTTNSISSIQLSKDFYIIHEAYPTLSKYVEKTTSKYAYIEASQLFTSGKKVSLLNVIIEPVKSFLKKYILQLGFLDGAHGLILCCLYSIYRFNVNSILWDLNMRSK